MCSICPNFILVSGVCTVPPTGNDKLKVLAAAAAEAAAAAVAAAAAAAAGGSPLGRKPDLTVLDCFLSRRKAGDAALFALQDF